MKAVNCLSRVLEDADEDEDAARSQKGGERSGGTVNDALDKITLKLRCGAGFYEQRQQTLIAVH